MRTRELALEEKIFFREILKDLNLPRFTDEKLHRTLDRVVYHDTADGGTWNPIVRTAMRRGFAAITLGPNIYFNVGFFPKPCENLTLQCHELVHACQAASFGFGTAFWVLRYFGSWIRFPYSNIPYEKQACEMEENLRRRLDDEPELRNLLSRQNRT